MNCQRCRKQLNNYVNKICDICIQYIGEKLVCQRCGGVYTRTNRTRHYMSYSCRICIFKEL